MGVDIYFVYEADDISHLEVRPVTCRTLGAVFELRPQTPSFEASVLNAAFVQDFPKLRDAKSVAWEDLTEGETVATTEGLDPYIGPTFEPQELVDWASNWKRIIEGLSEEVQRRIFSIDTKAYNWTPEILEDLREVVNQGECAKRHCIRMHIERY